MQSDDYIMIHTRTHDMSADIFTKGFQSKLLFRRLRQLINVYSPEGIAEFDSKGAPRGAEDWNPALLNSAGMVVEKPKDVINTQYSAIATGMNSKSKNKTGYENQSQSQCERER